MLAFKNSNIHLVKTCMKRCLIIKQTTLSTFQNMSHLTKPPPLLKPFLFTVGVGTLSLTCCAVLQYERVRNEMHEETSLRRLIKRKNEKGLEFRKQLNNWWNGLNEGHKVAVGIIGINALVFGAWRVPNLRHTMVKWFTSSTTVHNSSPLLLSCFSHTEFWHIGANMFVLWSFAPLIQHILGTEQFIGFYAFGGTLSSLASYYFKVAAVSTIPSLGASGALLAVLAACCIERPDARLSIIFLPFFTFSAQAALYSIIAIDVAGLLFRWKLFDHAGHLGGTLFGVWYMLKGQELTWDQRGKIVKIWHEFRQSVK